MDDEKVEVEVASKESKMNLIFCMRSAHDCGEVIHPQKGMRAMGITYEHTTPQSIGDQWWFWNCANVPASLPKFLSPLNIKPHDAIGFGLSKDNADRLIRAT